MSGVVNRFTIAMGAIIMIIGGISVSYTHLKQYPEFSVETENAYMKESFSSYPNISVDFGVLDKPRNVYMMKCDLGWADLGTWHSIYEAMQKSSDDNVVVDSDVMTVSYTHLDVYKRQEEGRARLDARISSESLQLLEDAQGAKVGTRACATC